MIAFGYYGGKFSHLDLILALLPSNHTHYCEPFGGSAAVLINRDPAEVETYNDLDSEVSNFFTCLRDNGDELLRLISLTPSHAKNWSAPTLRTPDSAVWNGRDVSSFARARRAPAWRKPAARAAGHTASSHPAPEWPVQSRGGSGASRVSPEIVQRLQRVQIENAPAIEVIRRYDSPATLFYCDPPYPHQARGDAKAYGFEMTDQEHQELAAVLHRIEGAAAVSSYRCPLRDDLYHDWTRVDSPSHLCNSSKTTRIESVWVNYDPPALTEIPAEAHPAEAQSELRLLERESRKPRRTNGRS
jgi:DNA adenine methylase